jgi:hypothetical protein
MFRGARWNTRNKGGSTDASRAPNCTCPNTASSTGARLLTSLCLFSKPMSRHLRFIEDTPRGRAGQARTAADAGTILFAEGPLVSLHVNPEDVRACTHCLRPIGRISLQLQHAAQLQRPPDIFTSDEDDFMSEEVPCRANGCEARFCSAACEELAHSIGGTHSVLCCRGSASRKAARHRFDAYIREQEKGFYFFALAERIVANILARYDQIRCDTCRDSRFHRPDARPCSACVSVARAPWRPFCQPSWYEIVLPLASVDAPTTRVDEVITFRASMRDVAARALELLRAALGDHPALRATSPEGSGSSWLDLACWGRLVGLARQNALEVVIENPAHPVVSVLRASRGAGGEAYDALLRALPTPLPNVEGAAIFAHLSCLNHSCSPNAEVQYDETHGARLIALCSIARGDEVTISYIDEAQPVTRRHAALSEYSFSCDCPTCEGELAWRQRLRPRVAKRQKGTGV